MSKLLSLAMALCMSLTLQAGPRPDFEVVFPNSSGMEAGRLTFTIRNNTGRDAQVLLIPRLERQSGDGSWEEVPFLERVGFCGMADPLPAGGRVCTIEPLELWGAVEDGHYRLRYEVTDAEGRVTSAQGEFDWELSLAVCGLPLAES